MIDNIAFSDFMDIIRSAQTLQEHSVKLRQMRESFSSDDFVQLLADFEVEVDKLNKLLINRFGEDPQIMQIAFELKAAIITLKANNVEMDQRLVETKFKHCSSHFGDYDSSRLDDNCL